MASKSRDNSKMTSQYAEILAGRRDAAQRTLGNIIFRNPLFLLEIGCGHGHFLTAYAEAHPHSTCVGIDLVNERINRATRKRNRAKLANLHFLRAEVGLFLQAMPPQARITDVFILFPDPWPKTRHHKHRILQPAFLDALAEKCEANCCLYFRTDYQPYFEDALAVTRAAPRWEVADLEWPFEFETVFQRRAKRYDSLTARMRPSPS